jgi:hypothetical protein
MQNKRLYVTLGVVILFVGTAAFLAGTMFHREASPVSLDSPPREGQFSISSNDVTPAPELPTTKADITGTFVERKDNTIIVWAVSFGMGVGGVSGDSPLDENSGIRVEVVVTGETTIYKDITELPDPVNGEIHNVQQAAAEGTLDDLNSQTFITVWGRRSGDRIIADVFFYSNPKSIKKP